MESIKTVSIIGIGAIGSFFVPGLLSYLGNDNLRIIAGGSRKERLENNGVIINDKTYKVKIYDPDEKCGFADLVIIAVKYTGLHEAVSQIKNHVGPDTIILSVLNGIGSEAEVAKVYGREKVLYSFMKVAARMEGNRCYYNPDKGMIVFGEEENKHYSDRVLRVKELMENSGIRYKIADDMIHDIWFKFMTNIGENMTSAILGIPYGAYNASEYAHTLKYKAMNEVIQIANAQGIKLGRKELEEHEESSKTYPLMGKSSTLQDIEAGKKTEVEMFSGEVARLGEQLGIATPVNEVLYLCIKILEEKNNHNFEY